jgi:hypothetical protein
VVRFDGLEMFSGLSTVDNAPELWLDPSDAFRARIRFRANLLRGTYIINVQLVDTLRQWPSAIVSGVGSFVVTETNRVAGCTELEPSYDIELLQSANLQPS